jgi:hypothetical protein
MKVIINKGLTNERMEDFFNLDDAIQTVLVDCAKHGYNFRLYDDYIISGRVIIRVAERK